MNVVSSAGLSKMCVIWISPSLRSVAVVRRFDQITKGVRVKGLSGVLVLEHYVMRGQNLDEPFFTVQN